MKKRFNIHWMFLLTFVLTCCTFSCSDDNPYVSNEYGSSLETDKEFKISKFLLSNDEWQVADSVHTITVKMTSLTDNSILQFRAKVNHYGDNTQYGIMIPRQKEIANSDYLMRGFDAENYAVGNKLVVTFEDEMLKNILSSSVDYSKVFSEGDGTEESPYQIKGANQFTLFLGELKKDTTHARNLHFIQMCEDLKVSGKTSGSDDFLYYGYPFAGNYDGNGKVLTLEHMGPFYQTGIFSELTDGASFKNLKIHGTMTDAASNIGFLAGKATGTVSVENVSLRGSIAYTEGEKEDAQGNTYRNGERIGGLIGHVKDAKLSLKDIQVAVTVHGKQDIGAVIGKLEKSSLIAQRISTIENITTSVQGHQGVGFLCGATQESSVNATDITYEQVDSKGLNATGFCLGGVIGYAHLNGESFLKNCNINANLESSYEVGGLIGCANMPNQKLHITDCIVNAQKLSAYTNTKEDPSYLGGFIGNVTASHIYIGGTSKVNVKKIEGVKKIGGLVGALEGDMSASSLCEIKVPNVTGKINMIGGVCGSLKNGQLTVAPDGLMPMKGMIVSGVSEVGGIVGYAENAKIQGNLNMKDLGFPEIRAAKDFIPTFSGNIICPQNGRMVGGIVGECDESEVKDCCFEGKVTGGMNIGGIVGMGNTAEISNCVNKSDSIIGENQVGGIVGAIDHYNVTVPLKFHHLLNFGNLTDGKNIAGIVGYVDMTNRPKQKEGMFFDYLVNLGDISGKSHIGGCIGFFTDNTDRTSDKPENGGNHFIRYCANYGKVTGTEGGYCGGIMGQSNSTTMLIHFSANHGEVVSLGNNKASVGGIVGEYGKEAETAGIYVSANGEIRSCCNFGWIHSQGHGSNVGGLVGLKEEGYDDEHDAWWWIKESYNNGTVTRNGEKQDLAGICGYLDRNNVLFQCLNLGVIDNNKGNAIVGDTKGFSTYDACYTLKGVADDDHCDALAEADACDQSKYEGFDFKDVWQMSNKTSPNKGFPQLQECPFQFVKPLGFAQ